MRSPTCIIAFIRCWNYENRIFWYTVLYNVRWRFFLVLAYYLLDVLGLLTVASVVCSYVIFWPEECSKIDVHPYNLYQRMVCITTDYQLTTYVTVTTQMSITYEWILLCTSVQVKVCSRKTEKLIAVQPDWPYLL